VLEAIRDHPRICRYLHVPGQSGSDRILKAMNRGYTVSEYLEFLDRARAVLDQPGIGRPLMVSGDIIVGFPTETEEDFDATVRLVERARYKNCFIFKYSPRPGTVAYDKLADDVPEEAKRRRNNALLALQGTISDEIGRAQVGKRVEVFIEGMSRREKKAAARRESGAGRGCAGGVSLTVGGRDVASAAVLQTPAAGDTVQLSGRTDGDLIVFIEADAAQAASLVGSIVPVEIERAEGLGLHARLLDRLTA
jgi:tRNA-2-methylthio-N6-dimethylallyladenosine synthase